jgi:hypothetical protein
MTWLVWHRHRVQALCLLVGLSAILGAFEYFGHAFSASRGGPDQMVLIDASTRWVWFRFALLVLPLLAGLFLGAPLFATDLEAGTHRLILTQGVTHRRWLTVNLALALGAVAGVTGLVGAAGTLVLDPTDLGGRWASFDQQLPVLLAYSTFAVTLGVAAGALVGRTFQAMAITLVGFLVARLGVAYLRGHFQPALDIRAANPPRGSLVVGVMYDGMKTITWSYQPPERFWTFQAIEAAIFLALGLALLVLAVWRLRQRMA